MMSNQSHTRINTLELKALIVKKIGHDRADKYFDLLTKLFALKITKVEFDKFCVRIIGRENLPLHNRLIRSIVQNACIAKVPPPNGIKRVRSNLDAKTVNGYQRNCLQSIYGDAFPPSPRKGRSPVNRERKFRDRPSPLGPLGKPTPEELNSRAQEQQSATELLSLGSRPPVEVASVEEGEEVEQATGSPGVQSRSPVTAPLGISMNLGGARKSLSNVFICSHLRETCLNSGLLPDTRSLRSHLERKLETEGLGVSLDCVNLLNNALDTYLKRLIEPCMGLANARHRHDRSKPSRDQSVNASILDFYSAMEVNPQILGVDWATSLEKISLYTSEE